MFSRKKKKSIWITSFDSDHSNCGPSEFVLCGVYWSWMCRLICYKFWNFPVFLPIWLSHLLWDWFILVHLMTSHNSLSFCSFSFFISHTASKIGLSLLTYLQVCQFTLLPAQIQCWDTHIFVIGLFKFTIYICVFKANINLMYFIDIFLVRCKHFYLVLLYI